jgi:hypothetical protein
VRPQVTIGATRPAHWITSRAESCPLSWPNRAHPCRRSNASRVRWEPFPEHRRSTSACLVSSLVLSLPGAAHRRAVREETIKWLGRLQKSSKFRWAWKSTCTLARLANRPLRRLSIAEEVDRTGGLRCSRANHATTSGPPAIPNNA